MGNPSSAKGHLGICNIMRRPYETISLQSSLLCSVNHLTRPECLGRARPHDFVARLWPEDWRFPTPAQGNDALTLLAPAWLGPRPSVTVDSNVESAENTAVANSLDRRALQPRTVDTEWGLCLVFAGISTTVRVVKGLGETACEGRNSGWCSVNPVWPPLPCTLDAAGFLPAL